MENLGAYQSKLLLESTILDIPDTSKQIREWQQRPWPGVKALVHMPTPAEPGRKWLEALSLGVNCLHSKSLFFSWRSMEACQKSIWQGLNEQQLAY